MFATKKEYLDKNNNEDQSQGAIKRVTDVTAYCTPDDRYSLIFEHAGNASSSTLTRVTVRSSLIETAKDVLQREELVISFSLSETDSPQKAKNFLQKAATGLRAYFDQGQLNNELNQEQIIAKAAHFARRTPKGITTEISSPDNGLAIHNIHRTAVPSVEAAVTPHESLDELTHLPGYGFLFEEERLSNMLLRHKGDLVAISIDLQGAGAVDRAGLGTEMEELFLKQIEPIIREAITSAAEMQIARPGGDEFFVLCGGLKKDSDVVMVRQKIEEKAKAVFSLRTASEDSTLIEEDILFNKKLSEAQEKFAEKKGFSSYEELPEGVGLLQGYVAAVRFPASMYDNREFNSDATLKQRVFLIVRDYADKLIADCKRQTKADNALYQASDADSGIVRAAANSALEQQQVIHHLPEHWLPRDVKTSLEKSTHFKEIVALALKDNNHKKLQKAFHHTRLVVEKVVYGNKLLRSSAQEPTMEADIVRLNKLSGTCFEVFGIIKPTKLHFFSVDVPFGEWNSFAGPAYADDVLSRIVCDAVVHTPHSWNLALRVRGGKIVFVSAKEVPPTLATDLKKSISNRLAHEADKLISWREKSLEDDTYIDNDPFLRAEQEEKLEKARMSFDAGEFGSAKFNSGSVDTESETTIHEFYERTNR